MEKTGSGIRIKHPGSATLEFNVVFDVVQLMKAGRVCSRWNGLSKSSQFWKLLPLRHWEQRDWTFRSLQLEPFLVASIYLGVVLRIRICWFLGLPDTHPDPFVTSTDPGPSFIKQK
jgi:hypothetical protein